MQNYLHAMDTLVQRQLLLLLLPTQDKAQPLDVARHDGANGGGGCRWCWRGESVAVPPHLDPIDESPLLQAQPQRHRSCMPVVRFRPEPQTDHRPATARGREQRHRHLLRDAMRWQAVW